jgi:hypothetical protein
MPSAQISNDDSIVIDTGDEQQLSEIAIRQLERERRFRMHAVSYAAVCLLLVIIWAISEYNNGGGWPTDGFSQSSSIPHVWNIWIIYPVVGLGAILAVDAWNTFGPKPITSARSVARWIA